MEKDRLEQSIASAATAAAAIYAFFSARLLEVAPAWIPAALGTSLAIGVAALWAGALTGISSRLFLTVAMALAAAGVLGLFLVGGWANDQSVVNDTRCANIQREMLLPNPRRTDLPDIFEALRCRATGNENIQFPKAADPPRAGHPAKKH